MMRHASWVRRADDPQTAWGWALRVPLPSRERIWASLFFGVGGNLFYLGMTWVNGRPPLLMFPAAIVGLSVVGLFAKSGPDRRRYAALPTLTTASDAWPVRLTLRDGRRTTGEEIGWIGFADGWLVYEGLRTSFALTRASVEVSRQYGSAITLRLPEEREVELVHLNPPALGHSANPWGDEVETWLTSGVPQGEPILPPKAPQPEIAVRGIQIALAGAAFFALFAAFAACRVEWAALIGSGFGAMGFLAYSARKAENVNRCLPTILHGENGKPLRGL